ncbi:nSTAND1 domain-containing NTPase [Gordonia sp. FQ]|uniref:nSTAND1 domain-containing NTPase n=1 Tax=Gordonia sp. FQ TaxID=3446634 RepID=UPI003F87A2D7
MTTLGPDSVYGREDLGKALTELRLANDLSVREVAAEADALVGTVAGWFAGQHAPTRASREMFERVLTVCGVVDPAGREEWWAAVERTGRRGGRRRQRAASPYRGFDPFTPDDSARYFGRDEVIARAVALVRRRSEAAVDPDPGDSGAVLRRAVVVVGTSGAGKSSLVQAGLLAQTREGGALAGMPAVLMTPGDRPVAALDVALDRLAAADDAANGPALLVIDQYEELWTQSTGADRAAFAERLGERLAGRSVVPVLALRADFYSQASEVPGLAEAFAEAQVVVPRMTEEQLREVIVRPAETVGATVDDELVQLLLSDLTAPGSGGRVDAGVLPLLSHALRATWEQSDGRRLTVADYVKTGRIDGAVEQTAEEVYGELDSGEQTIARDLLLVMVNVDEDTVTRRTLHLDEVTGEPVHRVLEAFADARLLTLSATSVQVTHEALLTAWPRLTGWLDADRERLLLQRRLRALSEPWDADGRPDDLLPGRARLELFAPLEAGAESGVADRTSREFLHAGHQKVAQEDAAERRRTRQLRRFAWSAAIFGLVAVLAAVLAVVAGRSAVHDRNDAERSRNETLSRQLAIQANQLRDRDPLLAAQLAMVAYRTAPTIEAQSTLIDTMAIGVPTRFTGAGGSLLLSRAGSLMVAASSSGQVRLFRLADDGIDRQIGEFRAADGTEEHLGGVALTPDGQTLLLGGHSLIQVWDVADPAHPRRTGAVPDVRGDANALTTSPNGEYLAAAELGAGLQVWRRGGASAGNADWRPVAVPGDPGTVSGAVEFTPDGRGLASSTVNQRVDLWAVDGDSLRPTGRIDLGWRDNQLAQGLAYSPDGKTLYAALRSRTIGVWDVADPAAPKRLPDLEGHTSYVSALDMGTDGDTLVSAGADNTVQVYRLDRPGGAPRILPVAANSSSALLVGDHVVSASDDGRIQDWPPVTNRTVVGPKTVFQIPYSARSRRLLAADTEIDGRLTQWRVDDGALHSGGPVLLPPAGAVFSGAVVVTPDGDTATLGSVSGTVYFADYSDPARPHLLGSVLAGTGLNETVDYSAASHLAVTGGTDQRALTVVDAADLTAPRVAGTFDSGSGVWWASLSPDGRRAAVATNSGQVRLLDLSDPAHPRAYPNPLDFNGSALAVRFSADGKRIVATSEDKSVAVADVSDPDHPRTVAVMTGPAGQLYSAAFSPDGKRIVAGGGNSEIWVWSLTGHGAREDVVLHSYPGTVFDVRFLTGGEIVAAGQGGLIMSWQIDSGDLVGAACARPGDRISRAEWDTYLPGVPYQPPC